MLLHRQRGQKLANLFFAHLRRVAFSVEENKPFDPVEVGVLRAQAVMPQADRCTYLIE